MIEVVLYSGLSLIVFLFAYFIQHKYRLAILNPLLLTITILISLFAVFNISYQDYMQGAEYLNYLLEPAVVLLGYPLYKQIHLLKTQWQKISLICLFASLCALTVSTILAKLLGLETWLIASMVSMNITTAVAMSTSVELGGISSITAVMVLVGGLSGSIFGVMWLGFVGLIKIPNKDNLLTTPDNQQKVLGMAIGCASHALGTATIAKSFPVAAAYSSTALILCAIFTALIAPIYVPFLLTL
ncbi:LrgB family protein [Paraglaciecola aquimarina]|uniref:LrgB family protein n=1 Tax=Paraglaciecola algarum TaxID=3050085 RepID=A0ABS9D7B4_9ALTE|nr:LrgB family protein [Paraglaciecola sp. G1-23]MCF2948670.1 LrgB family protein [Paraglaciecola sp. G1-23]